MNDPNAGLFQDEDIDKWGGELDGKTEYTKLIAAIKLILATDEKLNGKTKSELLQTLVAAIKEYELLKRAKRPVKSKESIIKMEFDKIDSF